MATLLGPSEIRTLAASLGATPTKKWGQNFVVDAGTVRRIVRIAGVSHDDHVVEVGPGLGSLTLALLETGARVTAIEIDPRLAEALPATVIAHAPAEADRLSVIQADAMTVTELPEQPTMLVANLPYNVSVPVILRFLEIFPSLQTVLVMVQSEVADRLAAPPGSRTYGIPSAKAAWYCKVRRAGDVGRAVFWPVPRVDSALVLMERRDVPLTTAPRREVFAVIDAAFGQRRKALRGALATIAGSPTAAEAALRQAGIEPLTRGEQLDVAAFARIAEALESARVAT
ncbi:16S rRNA (adenine(1518)-N(6)/adenine(1519)-N(6))-dimethyltransferase RsmA [Demequina sp. TTPB684]|uniref:16S rRNA (adenine(1518)-N(6)/adenine(1519)-N(6))- dimethyltransferase RsmA n=1 Tax=unclassified Demequina TaxID=2620311 RepID=UPI001CF19920|nr:16S rRNA (adenine(1518)-N(6)/adenine(1519)-N(6))-dimethyltransferase RsmA [Demequina sp. TMPB413]MCB2413365.1 16S rRNA (adenine(1518)-N(6)/adenine(1519)-N(6))-dimethyltransferase RsmA [Demequina sp. TTPB684]UPU87378.1 16S rRNA (adenine(1518)-N(6)/adenine(1519)-N(6))-dimethyltransferase RsmA [Demequina sp. TMPB413]